MSDDNNYDPLDDDNDKDKLLHVSHGIMDGTRLNRVIRRARYNRWCILLIIFCVTTLILVLITGLYVQREHCDKNYRLLLERIKNLESYHE